MTLSVFNPWHDMALANGTPNYQPPRSAVIMADELSGLSRLWEEEGRVTVWGWDPLVVRILTKRGVPRDLMPTDCQLESIRRLSSRRTAVKALAEMSDRFKSQWCESEDEVLRAMASFSQISQPSCPNSTLPPSSPEFLLKSPWSCSGKGLLRLSYSPCDGGDDGRRQTGDDAKWAWIRNILKRQGGVVVEPFYADKRHDFALEYEVRDGRAHYLGLSLFDTTGGTYTGNILDTEANKLSRLGLTTLRPVIDRHLSFINREIAPHYTGPLGIDLMLMADGAIHPCVEINLRRTMGWVALQLERTTQLPATFVVRAGQHYEAVVDAEGRLSRIAGRERG